MKKSRMTRERSIVEIMLKIYCLNRHGSRGELCTDCREILDYAKQKLDRCPFQEGKTTCGNCRVHCYKPGMRDKIKEVMRYTGPRMMYRHPLLALSHLIDGFRKEPPF
jgi:hypothetical protein